VELLAAGAVHSACLRVKKYVVKTWRERYPRFMQMKQNTDRIFGMKENSPVIWVKMTWN